MKLLACSLLLTSSACAQVLYDGALGTPPGDQGLVYASVPDSSFASSVGGVTTLDTTAQDGIYAGFGAQPIMDRTAGFTVRVDLRVLTASTRNPSRAGFSLLVLASDARGVEVGFLDDEIYALDDNPLFVRNEVTGVDTTSAIHRYDLTLLGDFWTLAQNGSEILSGPVRDYSAYAGIFDVYETPNLLFVGDNTTSARGRTGFTHVSVRAVPEPSVLVLAPVLAMVALRRRSACGLA
jgi:hypothetical protein